MNTQIKFDIVDIIENDLKMITCCKRCKNKCKIYSVSENTVIYCNKYKPN